MKNRAGEEGVNGISRRPEILVVEDSPTQAEKLKYVLEENHFQVCIAYNGEEALKLLKIRKPTIVVSDVIMPEMDGYELCRQIKTDKDLKDIPVILLTALSDPMDLLKGLQCSADNFITKPYNDGYLISRINHILVNRELRRSGKKQSGTEVFFKGQKYLISSERQQILDLLLSTYETAVRQNLELMKTRDELSALNEQLEQKVEERTIDLKKEVVERRKAEEELRKYHDHLEELIEDRTAQLKKMTEELSRSNADLQQFAYIASHDLQSPLRNVEGFVQLLARRYEKKLDDKADEYIKYISSGVKDMQALIHDLLEISTVDSGDKTFTTVDMSTCVDKAVFSLKAVIEEKNAEIVADEALPRVYGDASQLTSLLQNLIGNAIKFNLKQPKVCISSKIEGNVAVFRIEDNGIGMDKKDTSKIFAVFHRLHSKSEYPGTGIGLALCKKIVERHGGRIWVESQPGEGSTFIFTLLMKE